jgi:predicted DNA-binding protein (MmcQ/YjbR family)
MNIEEYRNYCLAKSQTTEETPFHRADNILVFKVAGKMFTATDINLFEAISVKCDPNEVEKLREKYSGVGTQPYMSKKHWNRVEIDAGIPDDVIYSWIDTSYKLVVKNLSLKLRSEINKS